MGRFIIPLWGFIVGASIGGAVVAGLIGILNSFRMAKLPDIKPSAKIEAAALG